jgi:hypothetical protein
MLYTAESKGFIFGRVGSYHWSLRCCSCSPWVVVDCQVSKAGGSRRGSANIGSAVRRSARAGLASRPKRIGADVVGEACAHCRIHANVPCVDSYRKNKCHRLVRREVSTRMVVVKAMTFNVGNPKPLHCRGTMHDQLAMAPVGVWL